MAKLTNTQATTSQSKNTVKGLIDTLIKLDAQADAVFVDMAEVLYQAKKQDAHVAAGYSEDHAGFVAFCDEKLKCGYRKAQYFISIWEKALEFSVSKDVMELIGWSKMKELVPILTAENVKSLLKAAQEKSLKNLLEYIASMKKAKKEGKSVDGVNSSAVDTVKYTFLIDQQDNDTVHSAIEEAKSRMETSNAAEAFVTICQDWLALGGGSLPNTLEDYMLLIERTFGVRVAIVEENAEKGIVRATPEADEEDDAPEVSVPPVPDDEVPTDTAEKILKMSSPELKAFASGNNIVIPATVKGKSAVREFLLNAVMHGALKEKESASDLVTKVDELDDLDSLETTATPEAEDDDDTAQDITAEETDEEDDLDLEIADHATLLQVAVQYKIEVPKNLKAPKQLEVLRRHIIDNMRAMGYGDAPEDNLQENEAIVAAEEEKDMLDEASTSLKDMAGFLKEKGYADAYVAKFGKPTNKSDINEMYQNTISLISEKYGVSFSPVDAGEGDDLL